MKKNAIDTYLVTGANGFVGRALCNSLTASRLPVRAAVRSSGQISGLLESVVAEPIDNVGPDTDWSRALKGVRIVIHLAARVHVMQDTVEDSLAAFREVNLKGTEHLARSAADRGVRRFIYMSSIKVCGEGKPVPYTERDAPVPQDPYGVSKWEAEQVLSKVAADTGLEVVIIRPPLVYGPHVKANFLRMLKLVGSGFPLPLGAINNRRSMVYVGNLIDAIMACVENPNALSGRHFWLVMDVDVSTPQLIRMIAAEMNKSSRLVPVPPALLKLIGKLTGKTAEVERLTGTLCVDSSKFRRMLNWQPPFTMEEGIKETVQVVYCTTDISTILLVIVSLLLGSVGAWFMSRYADKFGLIDKPNERSSHSITTPRGGGVGIVLAFLFAGFFLKDYFFTILAGFVGLIGLLEDRFVILPKIRLLLQIVTAALVVVLFRGLPVSVVTVMVFLFWIVFIAGTANFFNFMDGINGIAGLTGLVGFGLISLFLFINSHDPDVAIMSLVLSMGCLGFLPFNLLKARVFMGDVGSIFLGFMFASFVVKLSLSVSAFLCLIMFLSTFYADGLITMYYRWRRGEHLMEAHRSHLYQYACNELKVPHWKVSLSYAFVQFIFGILALLAYREGIMWQSCSIRTILCFQHIDLPHG